MNPYKKTRFAAMIAVLGSVSIGSAAPTYNWASWAFVNSQSAVSSALLGYGSVGVNVSGTASAGPGPWPIQFDNVAFTPVNATSVGAQNVSPGNPWHIEVDLTALSTTAGLVLGLGNFGTTGGGYQLSAQDPFGFSYPLTGFIQTGSHDHTWPSAGGFQFNDDVSLNTATGALTVTTVPGLNDINSDIMLLSLPAGVGKVYLNSVGFANGDTINVLVSGPLRDVNGVPDTATSGVSLLALGAIALAGLRRRR